MHEMRGRAAWGQATRPPAGPPGERAEGCPVSPELWRRLAKATAARRFVTLLVLVVIPVGSQSVLDAALAPAGMLESGWRFAARVGIGAMAIAGTAAMVLLTLHADFRRRSLVAAHDGQVHPRTLRPLQSGTRAAADARTYWWTWLVTAESPAVFAARTGMESVLEDPGLAAVGADGADVHRSGRTPSTTASRAPAARVATARSRADRAGGAPGPARPSGLIAALRAQQRDLIPPAVLLLLVPWLVAALAGRSPLTAAIVPAIAFVALAVVRCVPWLTVPAEPPLRRCHRCDHPLAATTTRCSECGTDVAMGQVRAARPRPARRVAEVLVASIVGCWLLGVVAGEPLARAVRTSAAVPSASLLADLSGAHGWDAAAFRTIVERGPDPVIASRLAEVLNQRRRAGARVGGEAWSWFDQAVADGIVPREHELVRWRDSVELLRLVSVVHPMDQTASWGGIRVNGDPASGTPAAGHRSAGDGLPQLALRFVRRFDAADGRRVGVVVIGAHATTAGDDRVQMPQWPDGTLCLVAAGVRPAQAAWLPNGERFDRPWPAPPEYVVPLPPLAPAIAAAAQAGEPLTLDVIRYVAAPGSEPISVTWTPFGHRLTGPVYWQAPERITLATAVPGPVTASASADADAFPPPR